MKLLHVFQLSAASVLLTSTAAFSAEDVQDWACDDEDDYCYTTEEAYNCATTESGCYILDVRTGAEWQWVGHPGENKMEEGADLDGKVINISYKKYVKKSFVLNPSFLTDVDDIFGELDGIEIITMCRSGGRAAKAAEALDAQGYNVKNMAKGFEGGSDTYGYRTLNGWKVDGYPYTVSSDGKYDD